MTQVPPTTPDAPATDPMQAASDAARDRIADQFPDDSLAPPPEGTTPPPPPAPATEATEGDFDLFADGALEQLDLGNVPYRDGKRLERDIARAREQYRPFSTAFGDLDEADRAAVLEAVPTLGADLARLARSSEGIHADDRQFFIDAMDLMATDPERAAAMLQRGSEVIRHALAGQEGTPPAAPEGTPSPSDDPDDDAPITRADLRAWQEQQEHARAVASEEAVILNEARDLGYDPDSTDPVEILWTSAYFAELGRVSDSAKAHATVEAAKQKVIDDFVQAKSADAGRQATPADAGGTPAPQSEPITDISDAEAAMRARLEGQFGPDPRRRGDD